MVAVPLQQVAPSSYQVAFLGSALAVTLVLLLGVSPPATVLDALLAAGLIIPVLYSGLRYLERGSPELPFLPYALLHFAVFFGLPVLWPDATVRAWVSPQPYLTQALLLALLCMVMMIAGYRLGTWLFPRPVSWLGSILPKVDPAVMNARLLLTVAIAGAAGLGMASTLAIGTDQLGILAFLLTAGLDPFFLFSILVFGVYTQDEPRGRLLVWLAFLILLVSGAVVGQIHNLLKPFVVIFVGRLMLTRKLTKSFIVLAVLGFIVINPVKNEYRRNVRDSGISVTAVADAWLAVWSGRQESSGRSSSRPSATQARLNELSYLANAVEAMPQRVDYQLGYPWRAWVVTYVPRLLWPDKPNIRRIYSSEWGVQFGYIQPAVHAKVALNLPLPVDGYWNFGVFGVALVGMVLGLALAFLTLLADPRHCMTFALGMSLFVATHANNQLGTSIADIPIRILLLSLLVLALNLLLSIPAVLRRRMRGGVP